MLNGVEIGVPYLMAKYRVIKENRKALLSGISNIMTAEERHSKYSKYETPLDDYMEVVIGYGYIVLFGAAFPFVTVIALVLSVLELKVDAWKLCNVTIRPFPSRSRSIGVWTKITQTMAIVGAGTNAAIIIFTTDVFDYDSKTS